MIMEIRIQTEQDDYILYLKGDLDFGSCLLPEETIRQAVQEEIGIKKLYINCRDLQFISSAGLSVFVYYLHTLQAQKAAIVFYEIESSGKRCVFDCRS
jgi:anti-sigma B factor antagonist